MSPRLHGRHVRDRSPALHADDQPLDDGAAVLHDPCRLPDRWLRRLLRRVGSRAARNTRSSPSLAWSKTRPKRSRTSRPPIPSPHRVSVSNPNAGSGPSRQDRAAPTKPAPSHWSKHERCQRRRHLLPTCPVSEELREKVTPLSANAAMRIAASFSEAEAGALHDIARVAGDYRKPNLPRTLSASDSAARPVGARVVARGSLTEQGHTPIAA